MKRINFKQLRQTSISGKESVSDVREITAETIYANAAGLKWKLLAEKIYKENVCEFTDQEWELFAITIRLEAEVFSAKLRDAIEAAIEEC